VDMVRGLVLGWRSSVVVGGLVGGGRSSWWLR